MVPISDRFGHYPAYISANFHSSLSPLRESNDTPILTDDREGSYSEKTIQSKGLSTQDAKCSKKHHTLSIVSVSQSVSNETYETKGLRIAKHSCRPGRFFLTICQGDRSWTIPAAWTQPEALRLLARKGELERLDLSLTDAGPPRNVEDLHGWLTTHYAAITGESQGLEVAA